MQKRISESKIEGVMLENQMFADPFSLKPESPHLLMNCWTVVTSCSRSTTELPFWPRLRPEATRWLLPMLSSVAVPWSLLLCRCFSCCCCCWRLCRKREAGWEVLFPLPPSKFLSGTPLAERDRKPAGKHSQEMSLADSQPPPTHRRIRKGPQTNRHITDTVIYRTCI